MASWGFLWGSAGKECACNVGHLGSIPGLGRSPREGKGYPLLRIPWTVQATVLQRISTSELLPLSLFGNSSISNDEYGKQSFDRAPESLSNYTEDELRKIMHISMLVMLLQTLWL